jgi:hypothetical protein
LREPSAHTCCFNPQIRRSLRLVLSPELFPHFVSKVVAVVAGVICAFILCRDPKPMGRKVNRAMDNNAPELQRILERLSRVERQYRRLKRCAFVAALGISAGFLMGQTNQKIPERIEAQNFVVRNAAGRGVAAFGLGPKGSPLLVMMRDDGKLGATLEVAPLHFTIETPNLV